VSTRAALVVDRLRVALREASGCSATTECYEDWIVRDEWRLDQEVIPLIVGCDPTQWANLTDAFELASEIAELQTILAVDFGTTAASNIAVQRVRSWAQKHQVDLPPACKALLDFIAQTLPSRVSPEPVDDGAPERERVLGAALALVTRFPQQCRDIHGFFDSRLIANLIVEKGALWFDCGQPTLSPVAMAELLKPYLE
jgi:hypothetical protein